MTTGFPHFKLPPLLQRLLRLALGVCSTSCGGGNPTPDSELAQLRSVDLLRERNRFAKEVMTEVRDRRQRKREADEADEPGDPAGLTIIGRAPEPRSLLAAPQQEAAP